MGRPLNNKIYMNRLLINVDDFAPHELAAGADSAS
jgi:hypothetical protein